LFGLVIRALPGLNLSGRIRCRVILRTIVRFVIPGGKTTGTQNTAVGYAAGI
jgi:hypothetical protein